MTCLVSTKRKEIDNSYSVLVTCLSCGYSMRVDASLTNSGSFRIHHVNAAIACSSATTLDDNTSGAHNSLLIGTVSSGLTAAQRSSLEQNNDTDAHIILSAEL